MFYLKCKVKNYFHFVYNIIEQTFNNVHFNV